MVSLRGVVARPEAWQVRPVGYGVHLRGRALLCACGVCLRRVPLPLRVSGGVAGFTCCGIGSPAGVVGLLTSGGLLAVLMSRPGADDRG